MDYFGNLPDEITCEILVLLPAESVLNCKLVQRSWRKIISEESFPVMHLHHLSHPSTSDESGMGFLALVDCGYHYFNFSEKHENGKCYYGVEKVRKINGSPFGGAFVGSCNGLVCLADQEHPDRPVCIWNPLTTEYVVLPEVRTEMYNDCYHKDESSWSFGFGHIALTDEYKVLGLYLSGSKFIEVYIYTLGSDNGWRDLGKKFSGEFTPQNFRHGSFANGAVYWIAEEVELILAFDLIQEKFCEHLAPPDLPPNMNLVNQTIGVLDGYLYLAVSVEEGSAHYDIWLLNNNSKKHQSVGWRKKFRVPESELLVVTKCADVLSYSNEEGNVSIYDIEASTSETFVGFKVEIYRVFPHQHTFISLRQLGKKIWKQ